MLENIYVLHVKFKVLTGLYIGGTDNGFDIGGADSNVIKNPITKEPYVPGSSIKGKLRSLLQFKYGKINDKHTAIDFTDDGISKIFEPVQSDEISLSRAIFRDFVLTDESKSLLTKHLGIGTYTEIKAENKINAIKGVADNPRFIERVPAGAEFEGEIVLNCFDGDDKDKMMRIIKESLTLLQYNYLGGSGTRGYGRVEPVFTDFEKVDL